MSEKSIAEQYRSQERAILIGVGKDGEIGGGSKGLTDAEVLAALREVIKVYEESPRS